VIQADVFNMGGTRNPDGSWNGLASLETVPVGNPGNANDTQTGYGSVAEPYSIGKYEITNAQWREFLTAKARVSDPYGLFNTNMAGTYGGIARTWVEDHYVYSAKGGDANWDNRPVNYVSFWGAARFCNWLHNGQGSDGDTENGAYKNIGNKDTFARKPGAKYFIPTENEWYKAAYYKGGGTNAGYWHYPTGTNTVPSNDLLNPDGGNNANYYQSGYTLGSPYYTTTVGEFENSESPYGTFDQGGNLWEWNETAIGVVRGLRGGVWNAGSDELQSSYRDLSYPGGGDWVIGFRVACVPEPSTFILLGIDVLGLAAYAWRRKK
jgi:formylglycine-generating enzyme